MQTKQFQQLIEAATGRSLTLDLEAEGIPLETKVLVKRAKHAAFEWTTPKKEDSLLRSFITAFCSRYREPDPETYRDSVFGDTWQQYAEVWNDPATHHACAAWHHHVTHMLSREKLRSQVEANFGAFTADMARLGFYATNYGIGIFTIYGGQWVQEALLRMKQHLEALALPFFNEKSDAGWVTRFVLNLDKPKHAAILGGF
jgi:hypothetical protein